MNEDQEVVSTVNKERKDGNKEGKRGNYLLYIK
jgi:hypothetical protein